MSQNISDNFKLLAPKQFDDRTGVVTGSTWRPFNDIAEFNTSWPLIVRFPTQSFWVLNPIDSNKADLYALRNDKTPYKVLSDVDLSAYYTAVQTDAKILIETNARIAADALKADITYVNAQDNDLDDKIAAEVNRAITAESLKVNTSDIYSSKTYIPADFTIVGSASTLEIPELAGKTPLAPDFDYKIQDEATGAFITDGITVLPDGGFTLNFAVSSNIVVTGQLGLFAYAQMLAESGFKIDIASNVYEPILESASSFLELTSTFSGWGTSIGQPQGFDVIVMRIRARTNPITSIKYGLFIDDITGTLIYSNTLEVTIPANTAIDVYFTLPEVYTNEDLDKLLLYYQCDQFCDRFGVPILSLNEVVFQEPDYSNAFYSINGTQVSFENRDGGVKNNWFKTAKLGVVLNDVAATVALGQSEDQLQEYFDFSSKEGFLNTYKRDSVAVDATEIFDGAAFVAALSTFSGWGAPIGMPQNFNGIRFRVKSRAAGTGITSVKCFLYITGSTGTLVYSTTLLVTIPSGTSKYLTFLLPEIYENADSDKLFFAYATNDFVDLYGALGENPFPEADGYGQTVYYINGTQTGTGILAPTRYRVWCEVGMFDDVVGYTDEGIEYLTDKLGIVQATVPTVSIILNSIEYAVEGIQKNIYFDNIISADFGLSDLTYDITCTKGQHFAREWRYTPIASDAGTTPLTIEVKYMGNTIASKTISIVTSALSRGTGGSIKINAWGDSLLSNPYNWLSAMLAEHPTNPTLTCVGTLGSGANKHEGRSGYRYQDCATVGVVLYKFFVSGIVITPTKGALYTHNGSTYRVFETNVTGGTGYVNYERTVGTNNPLSSGTLTKTSGTGDASIAFSSSVISAANILWNSLTNQLDVANYLTTYSITLTASDIVLFNLGINDIFSGADSGTLNAIKGYIDDLIEAFRVAVPDINFGIGIITPPASSQDAAGANYSNGTTLADYISYRNTLNTFLLANYDTAPMKTDKIYTIPFNSGIDRVNNFPSFTTSAGNPVNSRNLTATVIIQNNLVHTANSGYDQMNDGLYAFIKSLF